VHRAFALQAWYYATPVSPVGLPVEVRVHSKVVPVGSLGADGFARTTDDTEVAVFRRSDVVQLSIKKGGILRIADGRILRLQVRNAVLDDYTVDFGVTRV
jgi:hypothetical protein